MSDFEYQKMLEQIRNEKDPEKRAEFFKFIGEIGDDRFVEPLTELLKTDDSPSMRFHLYTTFLQIGTELAKELIGKKVKKSPPKDDGKKISKKEWTAAVDFLTSAFEKSFVLKVQKIIDSKGEFWALEPIKEIGIYVRTLLRSNGYDWGQSALEKYWSWIVEDALKKIEEEEEEGRAKATEKVEEPAKEPEEES